MWRNAASQMCRAEVKLEIKLQKELVSMGSEDDAGMPYTMRARGGYANGDFCEATPIYESYLWYIREMVNGKQTTRSSSARLRGGEASSCLQG